MAVTLGRDWILSVYDGTSTYNDLTGQTEGTFGRTSTTVDTTTKSDAGQTARLVSRKEWTFSASGNVADESDTALGDLKDAYDDMESVSCRFTSPAANMYNGACIVSSLEFSGPDDGPFAYTVELEGTGALT